MSILNIGINAENLLTIYSMVITIYALFTVDDKRSIERSREAAVEYAAALEEEIERLRGAGRA